MPYLIRHGASGVITVTEQNYDLTYCAVTLFWFHSAYTPIQRQAFINLPTVRIRPCGSENHVRTQVVASVRCNKVVACDTYEGRGTRI